MAAHSRLLSYELTNAVLGWAVIAVLLLAAVERAFAGEFLWTGMATAVIVVGLVPPAISRRPTEMIAWEVLALAACPVVARTFGLVVGQMTYLAVAAVALVVTVELDAFTSVEMTPEFAVAFVVIVTMAVAGLWAIARYLSDSYFGTSLLVSANTLMWELVAATGIGVVAGIVFELYFRRLSPGHSIPREPWGKTR